MKILLVVLYELIDDGEVGFAYTEASSKGEVDQEFYFIYFIFILLVFSTWKEE